jgi:hypothetical protein
MSKKTLRTFFSRTGFRIRPVKCDGRRARLPHVSNRPVLHVARISRIDLLTQTRVRLTHATTQVSPTSPERIRQAWAGVPMM